jgi:hypothetical protein
MNTKEPEFDTVDSFVQFLLDDGRETFMPGEAQKVAVSMGRSIPEVIEELKSWGFTVGTKPRQNVRGFTSPFHGSNRFAGNCGGSGWEQIAGWAGRPG